LSAPTLRRIGRETAVACFFLALAAGATRPLALDLSGTTLPGPDPLIDLWTVHWLSGHALQPSQLYEGNLFPSAQPQRRLLRPVARHRGAAAAAASLVGDPVPLYNLGLLLALAFGGWSFCALTRELTGDVGAGLVAGTLAAFGSHQLFHVYHLNLLSVGWLALLLLGLHRLVAAPGAGAVLLTGASFALCVQTSGYYAVAAALLPLLFAAGALARAAPRRVAARSAPGGGAGRAADRAVPRGLPRGARARRAAAAARHVPEHGVSAHARRLQPWVRVSKRPGLRGRAAVPGTAQPRPRGGSRWRAGGRRRPGTRRHRRGWC
jgi:hypothetical protein